DLSRIDLQTDEIERLSGQLKDILDFINKLNKLDIKAVPPTSHILPLNNVLRDDEPENSLPVDLVLNNAPHKKGNFFIVPKVIE
ncbi:MAG: Asp-tRNA(Asn)/Glu-tRNA(Gln) amidotransferase subunit GatC, partial [Candidatus Omnitrophota bacterium]